jgi:hypothetical protein
MTAVLQRNVPASRVFLPDRGLWRFIFGGGFRAQRRSVAPVPRSCRSNSPMKANDNIRQRYLAL